MCILLSTAWLYLGHEINATFSNSIISFLFYVYAGILTQPRNDMQCVGGNATFTCIVSRPHKQITSTRWQIFSEVDGFVSVKGQARHFCTSDFSSDESMLTEQLTITNVEISDNENLYHCHPNIMLNASNVVSISVAGNCFVNKFIYLYHVYF